MGKLMVGWSWVFKTINRAEKGGGIRQQPGREGRVD